MAKKIFVPVNDEILEKHPELLKNGVLVPFSRDFECLHTLGEEDAGRKPMKSTDLCRPEWMHSVRRHLQQPRQVTEMREDSRPLRKPKLAPA